jgi:1-acylglycerone phosphate reductase
MELQPLGISVLDVAPGAITSNLAANESSRFTLPEGSLWSEYLPDMVRRINASQGKHSMPTEVFARKVVGRALAGRKWGKGGYEYVLLGGQAWLFKILRWIPTTWLLNLMWRNYSRKA